MRKPTLIVLIRPATILVLTVILFLSGITYDLAEPVLNTTPGVLQQARILIDPGHGGIDPGTGEKFKLYEKDINLDMAFRLRELLESKGATIDLTRWSDQELSYLSPDLKAGRHRRDLWGRNERGSIVFYARGSGDGKALAGAVQAQLRKLQPYSKQQPLPTSSMRVVNSTQCLTILIEIGFITNSADRQLMQDVEYREQLATAIAQGIQEYWTQR
jgi:N-acetylmuramoyl-L-alanine amidase